ncbi:MAG: phosphoglucosamine mutase [Alphaproteobacteria bacterium]|nr:phosphoglucosamine mutase [Alphaproteobacteria bacterium]
MARNIFGTDGIRGTANTGFITPVNATKIAMAVINYYLDKSHISANKRFTVVIGKDTRLSGYMLESALTAGFISAGADVILLGPIPTPGVAFITRSLRADLGVVISASHNPYHDNGIKFFNSEGFKISPTDEEAISKIFLSEVLLESDVIGKAKRLDDAAGRYIEFAKSSFPKNLTLNGMKLVVDAANGAAYKIAPKIFWELGADVTTIGNEPNGQNINQNCGATFTDTLRKKVVETKSDIGIALDGDADRLIMVDETGEVIDGDFLIAAIATAWKESNRHKSNSVVATIMSNSGLADYLKSIGFVLDTCSVGDKYVIEKMLQNGSSIGGEKSGHIIPIDYSSTGDGCISAIQILSYLKQTGKKASDIRKLYTPHPQIFINIKKIFNDDEIRVVKSIETILGNEGRVIVRKSGTEPLTRIMLESKNAAKLSQAKDLLNKIIS